MDSTARFARVPVTGTILILAVAAMTMGCGVSKSKYMDVTKSRDELAAQNKELQGNLDAASKEKERLAAEKTTLEGQVQRMESQTKELNDKLAAEEAAKADLKKTYDDMIGHLQGELTNGKVEIQQVRDGIRVNLAQDILFRSGSADLDPQGREILLKVADDFKVSPFQVLVAGNTENQKIGPTLASRYPTNWELGGARAARIVRLYEEAGVPKDRLAAISLADSHPREPNDTPEGRARNRRIEITLRPVPSEPTANK
jgi:chemotaxis protein MotB